MKSTPGGATARRICTILVVQYPYQPISGGWLAEWLQLSTNVTPRGLFSRLGIEKEAAVGRGGIIWTVVGILLIIALLIYIF